MINSSDSTIKRSPLLLAFGCFNIVGGVLGCLGVCFLGLTGRAFGASWPEVASLVWFPTFVAVAYFALGVRIVVSSQLNQLDCVVHAISLAASAVLGILVLNDLDLNGRLVMAPICAVVIGVLVFELREVRREVRTEISVNT